MMNPTSLQRDLLAKLTFRYPDPCYLIFTPHGYALVVTTMMPGVLERMGRGYQAETILPLRDAGLVKLGEFQAKIPGYGFRKPRDFDGGYPIEIQKEK